MFRPQPGSASCSEVLKVEGRPDQKPACSPHGRVMCEPRHSDGHGISVSVHDLSTGQVVLTQAVYLPEDAQELLVLQHGGKSMAVWWSSCGSVVLICTKVWGMVKTSDYVTMLQHLNTSHCARLAVCARLWRDLTFSADLWDHGPTL